MFGRAERCSIIERAYAPKDFLPTVCRLEASLIRRASDFHCGNSFSFGVNVTMTNSSELANPVIWTPTTLKFYALSSRILR